MTARNPNTFIVGAGPVATALAGALRRGGIPVLGLWARKPQAARAAGAVAGVASYSAAPPDLMLEADVIIVAVRDEAIGEVAATLVNTGLITRRHVMLHCSGVIAASEAFAPVRDRLGGTGTLHPLRAIADGRQGMESLPAAVFGIEGDEPGMAMATALARAAGGTPLVLSGERMALYHAAAAMASNFVVALVDAAAELLGQAGVAEKDALAALVPLAQGGLANIGERGLAAGLTGPVRRGDAATIERHLQALSSSRDLLALYQVLGRRTLEVARRTSAGPERALEAIARLLSSEAPVEPDANGHGGESDIESHAYQA